MQMPHHNLMPTPRPAPQPLPQPQPPAPPPKPPLWKRIRWDLFVGLPLMLLVLAWVFRNAAEPSFTWSDIMDLLGVSSAGRDRYTKLAALGVCACCVCAITRILSNRNRH